MGKNIFLILGLCVLLVGASILILDIEKDQEFDVCEDQPTFGLKYTNCEDAHCVKFYEDIKSKVKEGCL